MSKIRDKFAPVQIGISLLKADPKKHLHLYKYHAPDRTYKGSLFKILNQIHNSRQRMTYKTIKVMVVPKQKQQEINQHSLQWNPIRKKEAKVDNTTAFKHTLKIKAQKLNFLKHNCYHFMLFAVLLVDASSFSWHCDDNEKKIYIGWGPSSSRFTTFKNH